MRQHSSLYWQYEAWEREKRAAVVKRALKEGLVFLFPVVTLSLFVLGL